MIVIYYLGLFFTGMIILFGVMIGSYNTEFFLSLLFLCLFVYLIKGHYQIEHQSRYIKGKRAADYQEQHSKLIDD